MGYGQVPQATSGLATINGICQRIVLKANFPIYAVFVCTFCFLHYTEKRQQLFLPSWQRQSGAEGPALLRLCHSQYC